MLNLLKEIEASKTEFIRRRAILEQEIDKTFDNYRKLDDETKELLPTTINLNEACCKKLLPSLFAEEYTAYIHAKVKDEINVLASYFDQVDAVRNKLVEEAIAVIKGTNHGS